MNDLIQKIKEERRWYEKSQLIFIYHKTMEMGTKRPNKHTIEDTARNISLSCGYVSEALKLVKGFPDYPNLTREEALRLIK